MSGGGKNAYFNAFASISQQLAYRSYLLTVTSQNAGNSIILIWQRHTPPVLNFIICTPHQVLDDKRCMTILANITLIIHSYLYASNIG